MIDHKTQSSNWFRILRDKICAEFERIEDELSVSANPAGRFECKKWDRKNDDGSQGGGGEMSVMRGRVFEKVGVNISTVHGTFSPEFRAQIPNTETNGGAFWATGVSLAACARRAYEHAHDRDG